MIPAFRDYEGRVSDTEENIGDREDDISVCQRMNDRVTFFPQPHYWGRMVEGYLAGRETDET